MCEFSQLPPGVMQDLTPLTQVHKVIMLNKYFAGFFFLNKCSQAFMDFFLPNNRNTIAELPESCKFTEDHGTSQDRAEFPLTPVTVYRNCVGSICMDPHVPNRANHPESALACATALLYFYLQLMCHRHLL